MTKKHIFIYIGACLSLFVPAPARFAYGIVLIIFADIILMTVIAVKLLLQRLKLDLYKNFLCALAAAGMSVFVFELLSLWSPVTLFTLGFTVYLIPLSAFVMHAVAEEKKNGEDTLIGGLQDCTFLSAAGLLFFAVRELFAYGSLSFPDSEGINVFSLLPDFIPFPVFLWAGIHGSLILLALFVTVLAFVYRKLEANSKEESGQ